MPVHVTGATVEASRSTVAPRQVSALAKLTPKTGVVLTSTWRSTTLEFTQSLSSTRFNCTTYSPGTANEWEAVGPVAVDPSSNTQVYSVIENPAAAYDADPSKLTASPTQTNAGTASDIDATAVGRSHGVKHEIAAAKSPTPLALERN